MVLSSPHVAAWFWCFSVRFTTVPVGVFWKRVVSPDKLAYQRVPLQSDPNLFHRRGVFINQVQNKLVFFIAVDLHKISAFAFAVRSSSLPTFDCATHKVTVAFEMRPTTGTGTYIIGDEKMELVIACYCTTKYKIVIWKYKNKIPENEENWSVPYQLFEKRYQWHFSCVYYLTELKKKLDPQFKKNSWEKIFF